MNTEKNKKVRRAPALLACLIVFSISLFNLEAFARQLIPCGRTVGVTVSTKGVCVINTAEFEGADGKLSSPAADAGIVAGDILLSINGKSISSADSLAKLTDEFGHKKMKVVYLRGGEEKTASIDAKSAEDGRFRLGVWIKDSESGIGTLTYIDPETKEFGALGHGICDPESRLTDINGGSILDSEITSVKRGERGAPGELVGIFSQDAKVLGSVTENKETGVFGKAETEIIKSIDNAPIETAERDKVTEGDVTILSNIEGSHVREYSAKITRINHDETSTKGMIIKITDPDLLEKTGGIVQGMSGSPIIQDGKLVGAITHVFVNDPTRGYGIFIENMLG